MFSRVLLMTLLVATFVMPASAAIGSDDVIQSIEAHPSTLTLESLADARRLIVTGVTTDGRRTDLTAEAVVVSDGPVVSVLSDGFVQPVSGGEANLTLTVGDQHVVVPVVVQAADVQPVDFVRDVKPLFSKIGCNAGTCHGSQKGKNGFKLSLRGYDAIHDYRALVDDVSGRRFNRTDPSQSLILLKPTQAVPHEGGFLFDEESRPYRVIQQWIAEGCRFDATSARVTGIDVFPPRPQLQSRGDEQQLSVMATYADGSTRDVTREAVFETSNFEVARVSPDGRVSAVRRGEAAALVRYEGNYAAAPVLILGDRSGFEWRPTVEHNFVDALVNAKLQKMKVLPADVCTDAEFLRRVSLDITGLPPSIEEIKAFVADAADQQLKRVNKIDELLNRGAYVDHWTLKWSDLLLARRKNVTEKGVWAFRNWIRNAVATDMPYDQFAGELITAVGSSFENPAANYYRVAREPKVVMENMTQVFLGTRFSCNQCHDHPFERWTQQQYYELAAWFADVGRKGLANNEELIYTLDNPIPVVNPTTNQAAEPRFPFAHADLAPTDLDRREQLSHWLTSTENSYFARSIVNRYWSYFLGLGIIDPVDDIRAGNPPSNPELLDALTADFVANGHDLKRLIRLICTSATYQRSLQSNEWNVDDELNFSHALPRRLTAEQLYDSIIAAAGAPRALPGVPAGFHAAQLPDPQVNIPFLDMFGRAPRESPCECERNSDVSLGQTLNMVNGPLIGDAIAHPDGLIAHVLKQNPEDQQLIETVYLATLCRSPSEEEAKMAASYFASVKDQKLAAEDLMWSLINSPAFLFNR
jgi:Protein of unknown function (DUF1549)/Protein of unknown function (DUF1553)